MGRFDDRATRPARGPRDMLRWNLDRLLRRLPQDPDPGFKPTVRPNDGSALRAPGASLTWVGHATFVLRLGGRTVVVDPVWSQRLSGVVPRAVPPGVRLEDLPPIDFVLLTHNHRDHFDAPTIGRIGPGPLYVAPLGNAGILRDAGAERVVELDWWQSHREGDLEITLVPARHWSMFLPWNRNDMLWGGFVVKGPEGAVYFAGDTARFGVFEEIGRRLGPIDLAVIPIGAYAPRWFMEPQHVTPEEAGEAFEALGARVLVAAHWGTFKLSDEPMGEPPRRIRDWWERTGKEPARLWILDVGETRALRDGAGR
ncbi:MAG: MBL fold metallo-hydrolase [Myxococcales bacterium]|jgi:L-ascorbate metabolism protein UlaG (beta-lactamase superfamily)